VIDIRKDRGKLNKTLKARSRNQADDRGGDRQMKTKGHKSRERESVCLCSGLFVVQISCSRV